MSNKALYSLDIAITVVNYLAPGNY